jgi:Ni/Fe-hydrogenase subunit HybB-like protein
MRIKVAKGILWFLVGIAATVAVFRFLKGLGTATALSDTTPWGLWIGFDVMGGVALAAGGFVMAACVYIFRLEKYHGIVRPAVLTAFLGYAAVIGGLVFDVGLPWNLWRPLYSWQHHSALFEVAMCVMFYFHVLMLEFAPVVFERLPFKRIYKILKALTMPLVIAGIVLSTLHQSSLGTLLIIMPFRIHPLWYSSILPIHFFISAVGLGLSMVITESMVSSWLYEKKPETDVLAGLARAASYVLGLYVIVKLGDLAVAGKLHYLTDGSWESGLFIFEMLISAIVPAVLFSSRRVRQNTGALAIGAGLAVFGFVLNRIDVSGLSTISATRTGYFPMWMEFAISIGVVSAAALAFFFFVENFSVYEDEHDEEAKTSDIMIIKPGLNIRLNLPPMPMAPRYAIIFVVGAAIGFAFMFNDVVRGLSPEKTAAKAARRVEAIRTPSDGDTLYAYDLYDPEKGSLPENAELVDALLLDGDRKNKFVIFNHEEHKTLGGGEKSCVLCHHEEEPLSRTDFCHECHRDMFLSTEFRDINGQVRLAPGYMDAMHERCVSCHADMDPPTARCNACHQGVDVSIPKKREVFALVSR